MTAAFKSAGSLVNDTGSGRTVPWPTCVAGDYALLIASQCNFPPTDEVLTAAAGFTLIGYKDQGSLRITVWWNVASSSSMASPVIAANGFSNNTACGQIVTFSGAADAAPDVAPSSGQGASNAIDIPGTTTLTADDLVVVLASQFSSSSTTSFSGWANADLGGFAQAFDGSVDTTGLGEAIGLGGACGSLAVAGAYGDTTATGHSTGFFWWVGMTVALTPGSSPPPPTGGGRLAGSSPLVASPLVRSPLVSAPPRRVVSDRPHHGELCT